MTITGINVTRLTNSNSTAVNGLMSWSNDGTKLAFASNNHAVGGGCGPYQIYVMDASGSNQAQLTSDGENVLFFSGNVFGGIEWSPDDTQITLTSNRNGGTPQVFLMNADGSSQAMLTSDFTFSPRWQPAGSNSGPEDNNTGGEGSGTSNGSSATLASTGDNSQLLTWLAAVLMLGGLLYSGVLLRKQFATISDKPQ
jgi:LPXTG-motif cell wall-anchored protein